MAVSVILLRSFLLIVWTAVAAVTVWALLDLGVVEAPRTFLSDLHHPWRAQFYADLEAHLLLVGAWMIYRERLPLVGLACAAATLLLGALFSLPYVLLASVKARGDMRRLLLGARA
jgi:hypothetical protein